MALFDERAELTDDQVKTMVKFFKTIDPKALVDDRRYLLAHHWLTDRIINLPEFIRIMDVMLLDEPESTVA